MPVQPSKLLLATLLFLIFCADARAQNQFGSLVFRIDSLANVGLPKSALAEVDKLDKLARKTHNAAQQVNAVIYRITFQSYTEEDALGKVIDGLKADIQQADYPVKPVLQSLLAQIYWQYYQENRYAFGDRSRLEKPGDDFTKWDLQTISNEVSRLYKLSLNDAALEQKTQIGILDGVLQGDPATRYLRPTLYDLLVQRAIDYFFEEEAEITRPKEAFILNDPALFAGKQTFSTLKLITTDTASNYYQGMKLMQTATVFHLVKGDIEAQVDLDLKRLAFLNSHFTGQNGDSLYTAALKNIVETGQSKPGCAMALASLAESFQKADKLKTAVYYANKAIYTYPKTRGAKSAFNTRTEIFDRTLNASVENINVADRPILASVSYRNLTNAEVAIYRLTGTVNADDVGGSPKYLKLLYKSKPVQSQHLTLPGSDDYTKHTADFKIAPLLPGNYVLLIKNERAKDSLTSVTAFAVSRLAYAARLNPDGSNEIRVLDRQTGAPLQGVTVSINQWTRQGQKQIKQIISSGKSDKNGTYLFKKLRDNEYGVVLSLAGDSYNSGSNYVWGATEPNNTSQTLTRTIFFTDRQLYRPGQTIYFKGIAVKTVNGHSELITDEDIKVNLLDANRKQISTLNLHTNSFGSVAGTFIIPQAALGGNFTLNCTDGYASFSVEEYKRPTFNAAFSPITSSWHFNDSVHVKGNVMAFSGYGLSNARVAYHITRQMRPVYHLDYYFNSDVSSRSEEEEVSRDTVKTNANGEFTISFKAIKGNESPDNTIDDYSINADITDANGETHSAYVSVPVSANALQISADLPENLFARDRDSIKIALQNLIGQAQNGKLNVAIYALKQAGQTFKDRKLAIPDQYIMSRADFKAAFPTYAWKQEDEYENWPALQTIDERTVEIKEGNTNWLSLAYLKTQSPGVYRLIIKGRNETGDTTSIIRYINVIGQTAKAQRLRNWVLPEVISVKKGGKAVFWVGTGRKGQVLLEKYIGPKLLSAEWLVLDGGDQQKIEIPVPATPHNNFNVQFLMINDNRYYHDYERLPLQDTTPRLKIQLLTYRDKMQPGEKESWKIQIGDDAKQKPDAELLAAMYDASLDDIDGPAYWTRGLKQVYSNPTYFTWNNADFTQLTETSQEAGLGLHPFSYLINPIAYEGLGLSDFNYRGADEGGNYFAEKADTYKLTALSDKLLQKKYTANALLVKKGYDIVGRVFNIYNIYQEGVQIRIKNTKISTSSNSLGYFRIKVPQNAILQFAHGMLFKSAQFQTHQGGSYIIRLKPGDKALEVHNPGPKSMKFEPDQVIRIDEPVGNSDTKAAVEDSDGVFDAVEPPKTRRVMYALPGLKFSKEEIVRGKADIAKLGNFDEQKIEKPITIRRNFNETAFFYPQLRTNQKGEIMLEFTMPDALTKWRFRAFAHTKDLRVDNLESTMVTQKQLSINANMPRFMREGDTITVSARLANLTTDTLKGRVTLRLFNALNMQPVKLLANPADSVQSFKVAGTSNQAESFKLIIPAGLEALTYRLTAESSQYTDGEENTLPVLPNRELVTESMPFMVRAGQSKVFTFDKLINQHSTTLQNKTLTLEYTQNPGWYALQALPYMMEFPHECAEQLFSRYYANSLATSLLNHNPLIKQVFDQWKATNSTELLSNLEKNQELKATLLEETPWLRDAANETEQKKRLALLFDLNKMSNELNLNLDKLKQKQLPNGGFVWFGGNTADRYITQHILEGIGQLYHLNIVDDRNSLLSGMRYSAMNYLNGQQLEDDKQARKLKNYASRDLSTLEIHTWYARSYFDNKELPPAVKTLLSDYLKRAETYWLTTGIYEQGMIALTMLRNGKAEVANAIIKSLTETAQHTDDMGMYWAKNQRGYYWYQSPVETQCLMIELFTEAGKHDAEVEEMKIWLLRNKQLSNWQTTTATAAACYALLMKNDSWLAPGSTSAIKLDGHLLEQLKPDVKADAGTGYIKTTFTDEQIKPALGKVSVANNGKSMSWGALHWQYLEQLDKVSPSNTDLHLERKYFMVKQTASGTVLSAVDASHQPKPGDRLKVVIYLKADHDFEYVQLKDMRPAGTEPEDALSEGKYQDGLYYYQVTKDVATNFFISWLTKGNYVFEYQLRVAQPGHFSTGVTSIQSMYAPEFNAHSEGMRIGFGQ